MRRAPAAPPAMPRCHAYSALCYRRGSVVAEGLEVAFHRKPVTLGVLGTFNTFDLRPHVPGRLCTQLTE